MKKTLPDSAAPRLALLRTMRDLPLPQKSKTYDNISTLPNELLANIFVSLKHVTTHDIEMKAAGLQGSWMRVAHVCSHWRQVALATPQLWSTILMSNPDRAQAMLQRCKDTPLRIQCDLTAISPALDLPHIISSRSQQIHILMIKFSSGEELSRIIASVSCFPNLRGLSFDDPLCVHPPSGALSKNIRWPEMPALRHLEILYTSPQVDFPIMPSLVRLNIHLVSLSCLIHVLKSSPNLEEVDVTIRVDQAPPKARQPRILLPRLRVLSLSMGNLEWAPLFEYFDIPSCDRMMGRFDAVHRDGHDHVPTLQVVCSRFLQVNSSWRTLRAYINFLADRYNVGLKPLEALSTRPSEQPYLTFSLPSDSSLVHRLSSSFPLSRVTYLNIDIPNQLGEHPSPSTILSFLSLFSHIRTLSYTFLTLSVLPILITTVDGNLPAPHLEDLCLVKYSPSAESSDSTSDHLPIVEVLRERKLRGFPIQRVTLRGYFNISESGLAELNGHSEVFCLTFSKGAFSRHAQMTPNI